MRIILLFFNLCMYNILYLLIDLLNDKKVTETSDNRPSDLTTLTKGLGEVIRQISVGDLLTPKVH